MTVSNGLVRNPPKARKPEMGRLYKYNDRLAQEVLLRVSEGESVLSVCKDAHMPSRPTISSWAAMPDEKTNNFATRYANARNHQADHMFEELMAIANEDDEYEDVDVVAADGTVTTVQELKKVNIHRNKLRIDTAKWVLARMAPRKYGDATRIIQEDNSTYGDRLNNALAGLTEDDD